MTPSARRRRGLALLLQVLLVVLAGRTARAEDGRGRPLVVVLRPSGDGVRAWPEGTQAVVAELVAGGYELMLRASTVRERDELLLELARVAAEEGVLGAVVVMREGELGVAYLCTAREGPVRVETGVAAGAVGEGELALRITQLLGPPTLDVPRPPVVAKAPAVDARRPDSEPRPEPAHDSARHDVMLALGIGLAWSSDLREPLPFAGFLVRKGLVGALSIDGAAALTLAASRLETAAGSVDVTSQQLTSHLSFDPFRGKTLGVSLGLGGGVVWVHGDGTASGDYSATDDSTRVGVLSARAVAFFTHSDFRLLVALEPGVLLPAVSLDAGDDVARLGRPWTQASVGLGWSF